VTGFELYPYFVRGLHYPYPSFAQVKPSPAFNFPLIVLESQFGHIVPEFPIQRFLLVVEPLIVDNIVGHIHHRGESIKHPFPNNTVPSTEQGVDIATDLQTLKDILKGNALVHHLVAPIIVGEGSPIPTVYFGLPVELKTVYY
jgi:hypothetical protein